MCLTFYVIIRIQLNHFRDICAFSSVIFIKSILTGIDIDVGVIPFSAFPYEGRYVVTLTISKPLSDWCIARLYIGNAQYAAVCFLIESADKALNIHLHYSCSFCEWMTSHSLKASTGIRILVPMCTTGKSGSFVSAYAFGKLMPIRVESS